MKTPRGNSLKYLVTNQSHVMVSKRRKIAIETVLCLSLLLSVFSLSIPVSADYKEDFSNPNIDDWDLSAVNNSESRVNPDVNPTPVPNHWKVEDGVLLSEKFGEYDPNVDNIACKTVDFSMGEIQFQVFTDGLFALNLGKNFDLIGDNIAFEGFFLYFVRGYLSIYSFDGVDYPKDANEFALRKEFTGFYFNVTQTWSNWSIDATDEGLTVTQIRDTKDNRMIDENADLSNYEKFDTVCLLSGYSDGEMWDNIDIYNAPSSDQSFWKNAEFLIVASVLVGFGALIKFAYDRNAIRGRQTLLKLKSKYRIKRLDDIRHSINLREVAIDQGITDTALLNLITQKPDNDPSYLEELKNNIPTDLLEFKYLMHPIRMMILKVLHGEFKMTSTDMQKVLDLSASEFNLHKKSLEEKGYIEVRRGFSPKGIQLVMFLTKKGKEDYEQLKSLLSEFVEENTPYYFLIQGNQETNKHDELYPDRT